MENFLKDAGSLEFIKGALWARGLTRPFSRKQRVAYKEPFSAAQSLICKLPLPLQQLIYSIFQLESRHRIYHHSFH
jgi:hypothetical protein